MAEDKKNKNRSMGYINSMIGKVLAIPDEKSIVVSAGSKELHVNDEVCIIERGPEMIDPETKEVIGTFDFVKARLKVTDSFESYSICKKSVMRSMILPGLQDFMSREYEAFENLPVDPDQVATDEYKIKNPKIKVGDPVIRG